MLSHGVCPKCGYKTEGEYELGSLLYCIQCSTEYRIVYDLDTRKTVSVFAGNVNTAAAPKSENKTLGSNPKDRLGSKKVSLHLVPQASLIYQALGMEDGAKKYGPYNWRDNKVIASIYISACMRHLGAWFDGEECAEDSQKPHLAHAISCIGILIDALETGNLVDDRPTKGAAATLIKKWEKKES